MMAISTPTPARTPMTIPMIVPMSMTLELLEPLELPELEEHVLSKLRLYQNLTQNLLLTLT